MDDQLNADNEGFISPKEYFNSVKGFKHESTKADIEKYAAVQDTLMKKALITGQKEQLAKLKFISTCLKKEAVLIDYGITSFVYKEDILAYADKISDKSIHITELENFPREVPDEVVEQIAKLKEAKLFDQYFIVYTDYAEMEPELKAKVQKERDPILFGTFVDSHSHGVKMLHNRFYYIADWEDEYCDLTLSKMVETMAKDGKNIEYKLSIPVTKEQLETELASLERSVNVDFDDIVMYKRKPEKKHGFFNKIKTFLTLKHERR